MWLWLLACNEPSDPPPPSSDDDDDSEESGETGDTSATGDTGPPVLECVEGEVVDYLWWKPCEELCPPANASASFVASESLVGSSRVDLQACKLEYSIVSPK